VNPATAEQSAPQDADRPAPYEGAFDAAPAFQYSVALPGGRSEALTHAEWSSPVLDGDLIFVGSASGRALFALSRRDGTLLHTYPAAAPVESEAVVSAGKVYFSDSGGNTWCYRLDGTLVWTHDGTAPILVAPTVDEAHGLVLVTAVDDLAMALRLDDGQLVWQYKARRDPSRRAELSLYASPRAVVADDGTTLLLGFSSGAVVAVDLVSGDESWSRAVGEGRYPDVVADVVTSGPSLFASGYFGPFVAVDRQTHDVLWRVEAGAAHAPLLVAEDGRTTLYHPGTDGDLRAVNPVTGAVRWEWDSDTTGAITTPRWTAAGLVVASSEGGLWLVDPDRGETVWKWREPLLLTGISSPPTVEGRQLVFVTNAGRLYSLLVPEASPPPRPRWP
jgi:outer membrane protein assembly factor BamB